MTETQPATSSGRSAITRTERSLAPDIARGMMLLFIAIANVPAYLYGNFVDDYGNMLGVSSFDTALHGLQNLVILERSRPMFAILYGFGMAMMAQRYIMRSTAAGVAVHDAAKGARRLLTRRSLWLIALGFVHSVFLFIGDILVPYGVTGLIALFFVTRSDKAVKAWMWSSLAVSATLGTAVFAALETFAPSGSEAGQPQAPFNGATYMEQMLTGFGGSLLFLVLSGAFVFFVPLVAAGVLLLRRGWLTDPGSHLRPLRLTAIVGTVVGLITALPMTLISLGWWEPESLGYGIAVWLTITGGMVAGLAYICIFALVAYALRGFGRRGPIKAIAALGERSLSGYLMQSILMAPVLSAWGLGWGNELGYAAAFGYASLVWLITVGLAYALDSAGKRGPFEVLLRRLTYGKR